MLEKSFRNKYGPWALLIGAAEGMGEAYSIALAKRGLNIVMVDKKGEAQLNLAKKIESKYGIETKQIVINLNDNQSSDLISEGIKNIDCRLLIYNAAYSRVKPFIELKEEDLDNFSTINVSTQLKLVHRFSKMLLEKKQGGGIILMSSLAGLIGVQLVSTYAATKAFAWNLSEALHYELKEHNIDVISCIAGATATPTYLKTDPKYGLIKPSVMHPEKVVDEVFKKLGKRALYIPGFSNRLNYFLLTRLMPRKMAASIANKTIYKMYSKD